MKFYALAKNYWLFFILTKEGFGWHKIDFYYQYKLTKQELVIQTELA